MRKRLFSSLLTAGLGLTLLSPAAWASPVEPDPTETTAETLAPAELPDADELAADDSAPAELPDADELAADDSALAGEAEAAAAPGGRLLLSNVHADVVTAFWGAGALQLGSQADFDGQLAQRVDPASTTFVLSDAARTTLPAGFDFVGAAGSEVWLVTQTGNRTADQKLTALWPGFSTEHLPAGAVDNDTVRLRLHRVSGPAGGKVELWQGGGAEEQGGGAEEQGGGAEELKRLWSNTDRQFSTFSLPRTHMHTNWAFTQPGVYRLQVRALYSVGGQEHTTDQFYTFRVGEPVSRLAGANRYATAAQLYFAGTQWGNHIVLASGENFADALAATPLAGLLNAPLLLTPRSGLHAETRAALVTARQRGAEDLIIAGGTGSVSQQVEDEVRALGFNVSREGGTNRYATATAIARRIHNFLEQERRNVEAVFVVDGTNFADALATGPVAAQQSGIILLTNGGALPRETAEALNTYAPRPIAVGGAAQQATAHLQPEVIVGKSRYETAAAVAQRSAGSSDQLALASGTGFPDALAAGAYAARTNQVFLLTDPARVPAPVAQAIQAAPPALVTVVGGPGSIQPAVTQALTDQLEELTRKQ
ncbi:cell wall-binding repeat-containing protein [Buchananella hordeovulneris]|uniref:cell wall-binding repeat-containing protein n=1 Tax=Buchananella hordeovulneris TaxID=52770 RepID=UPI00163AD7CF|nr:cell wall-binding repeat-containing protein [Buchananella hordeovulneris]